MDRLHQLRLLSLQGGVVGAGDSQPPLQRLDGRHLSPDDGLSQKKVSLLFKHFLLFGSTSTQT